MGPLNGGILEYSTKVPLAHMDDARKVETPIAAAAKRREQGPRLLGSCTAVLEDRSTISVVYETSSLG